MYLAFANLIHFTTEPAYGTMSEAAVTGSVLDWVGEAQDIIDDSYRFTVTYGYNQIGFAVSASILLQQKVLGVWNTIGTYSPLGASLSSIISSTVECVPCTPSDIPSQPIHYYVEDYYEEDYYV